MPRTAVIVPAYRRPEYTERCIMALESAQDYQDTDFYLFDDGSNDGTYDILSKCSLPNTTVLASSEHVGLRNVILNFFELIKDKGYDYLAKVDNDCLVPKNWLNDLIYKMMTTDADILSPNVTPSDAAFVYGISTPNLGYRLSKIVGGLWFMKARLINDCLFERISPNGIMGAHNLIIQIVNEHEAKCGWITEVTFQDIGHWSGSHPEHIKSEEHREYSVEIGREISW